MPALDQRQEHPDGGAGVIHAGTRWVSDAHPSCGRRGRRVQGQLHDVPLLHEAEFPFPS